ncbi:hypothetical protein ACSBR2_007940 [Camellia fascicularis]
MGDFSIKVMEENCDASQEAKVQAMEAIFESIPISVNVHAHTETGGSNRAAHTCYFAQSNLSNYVFRFSHRDCFSRSLLRRTLSRLLSLPWLCKKIRAFSVVLECVLALVVATATFSL